MSGRVLTSIVKDGLVFYIDAANANSYTNGSATWKDLTINNNNGTLINTPTFDSTNQGSIAFNGSNQYISVANTNSSLTFGTGNFTLESWFNTNGASQVDNSSLLCIGTVAGVTNWQLCFTSNILLFYRNSIDNTATTFNATTSGWNQVVVSRSSTATNGLTIYINGVSNAVGTANANFSSTSPVKIGQNRPSNAYYNGSIAATRMYNRSLSDTEVAQNYNAFKKRFNL